MTHTYTTDAIVLQKKPLREADDYIDALTQQFGKRRLVVKGARKLKSKLAGRLLPFAQVTLQVAVGKRLDVVVGVQGKKTHSRLYQHGLATQAAAFACEMLNKTLSEDAGRELYQTTVYLLGRFDEDILPITRLLIVFMNEVLRVHGLSPQLQHDIKTKVAIAEHDYYFSCAEGGLCQKPVARVDDAEQMISISKEVVKMLRICQRDQQMCQSLVVDQDTARQTLGVLVMFLSYNTDVVFKAWPVLVNLLMNPSI